MKITKGKWKTRNRKVVEIEKDKEGYYTIWIWYSFSHSRMIEDKFYYDDEGICYRDKRLNADVLDIKKTSSNSDIFANWDLIELVEEEVKVLKRNSNPILTLDLCTE
jgi:hypothetical protein